MVALALGSSSLSVARPKPKSIAHTLKTLKMSGLPHPAQVSTRAIDLPCTWVEGQQSLVIATAQASDEYALTLPVATESATSWAQRGN